MTEAPTSHGPADPARRRLLAVIGRSVPIAIVAASPPHKGGLFGCVPSGDPVSVEDFLTEPRDDTTSLQTALASGSSVSIPAGITLTVTSDVVLAPGQSLLGEGASSRLRLVSNRQANNIKVTLSDRCSLANLHVEEIGVAGRTGLYGTVFADGATGCTVRKVEVSGSSSAGMLFINSSDVVIDDCYVHDTRADGIHAQRGSRRVVVSNCRINRSGDDGVAFVSHGVDRYGRVAGCRVSNCEITDINRTGSGVAVIGALDVSVSDCRIKTTPLSGIRIASAAFGAEGSAISERITVTGNVVERTGIGAASGDNGGIFIEGCLGVTVTRNRIIGSRGWGIATSNIVRRARITDNEIIEPGDVGLFISVARGDVAYARMWGAAKVPALPGTDAPSSDLLIAGNRIVRPVATGIHVWGQADFPASDVLVRDNVIEAVRKGGGRAQGLRVGNARRVEMLRNEVQPAS